MELSISTEHMTALGLHEPVSTQYADIGELVRQLCEQHVHPEDIITKAEPLLDEDGERIFGEPMTCKLACAMEEVTVPTTAVRPALP